MDDDVDDVGSPRHHRTAKLNQLKGTPIKPTMIKIKKTRYYPSDKIRRPTHLETAPSSLQNDVDSKLQ